MNKLEAEFARAFAHNRPKDHELLKGKYRFNTLYQGAPDHKLGLAGKILKKGIKLLPRKIQEKVLSAAEQKVS